MKTRWILAAAVFAAIPCVAGCATDNSDGGGDSGPTAGVGGSAGDAGAGGEAGSGGEGGAGGGDEGGKGGGAQGGASSSSSSTGGAGGEGGTPPPPCNSDGIKDEEEQCDGTDFGGKDCTSFGLGTGSLVCNSYCGIVVSNCMPKESCNDATDNDLDGLYDCDDIEDCLMAPACVDSCTPPKTAIIPAYVFATTQGRPAVHSASCNGGNSGNEIVYEVVAPSSGDVALQLWSWSGADLSLSMRSACGDDASEIACANAVTAGNSSAEVLTVVVTMGTKYYVMVDGVAPDQKGQFDLQIYMPLPESDFSCTDLSDNDADGYLDCDDASICQTQAQCIPGNKSAGEQCFGQNECASPNNDPICLMEWQGFPGGYCSQFCDLAAPDCTGDSICADLNISVHGVCLDGCTSDGDCRPGYACSDQGLATKVCTLAPENQCSDFQDNDKDSLVDCEDPNSCQSLPDCTSGPQATGDVCTTHSQCSANANDPYCLSESWYFWEGGYCSQFCNLAADDCGPGAVCANWFFFASGSGTCFKTCNSAADCRPGYICDNGFGSFPQNVCHW